MAHPRIEDAMNAELFMDMLDAGFIQSKVGEERNERKTAVITYTKACIKKKMWNEVTLRTRGIVVDRRTNRIFGHCMPKYFNHFERPEDFKAATRTHDRFLAVQKLDGYLIHFSQNLEGEVVVSSKGQIRSVFADEARRLYVEMNNMQKAKISELLAQHYTLAFELLWPERRIVVNHSKPELKLIAVIDPSGNHLPFLRGKWLSEGVFEMPFSIDIGSIDELSLLQAQSPRDHEGFILEMPDGDRFKLKTQAYFRLSSCPTRAEAGPVGLGWWLGMDQEEFDQTMVDLEDEALVRYIVNYIEDVNGQCDRHVAYVHDRAGPFKNRPISEIHKEVAEFEDPSLIYNAIKGEDDQIREKFFKHKHPKSHKKARQLRGEQK